jgi:hypothetical protein
MIQGTWENQFMALCKMDFIMTQYGSKSELPDNFQWHYPI